MYRKRLKNVYELLETGNNKKVIQEVDKLVSSSGAKANPVIEIDDEKLSVMTIARSLKSLALVRLGRQDEAEIIVDDLLNANTKDENALNILMQYCKETQQLGKIVLFYENAVKNSPAFDEEMLTSLFYAYVRNRDYVKQQQCAIKLYKETSKRVYLCWNAMSYFLMHKYQAASGKMNTMNLQLAEKLLEKQLKEKKLESGGEYQLYLLILETREDYRSALKILDQPGLDLDAKLGMNNYTIEKRIGYLRKLGEWDEIRTFIESKLDDALLVDNWTLYAAYIESLDHSAPNMDESEIDKIIERFDSIRSKKSGEKIQGPYLAKIELATKRKLVDKSKQFLKEYVETFAGKPGFIYDLNYFSQAIRELGLAPFLLDHVLKPMMEANKPPFASIKSIYTCLSYFQFKRCYFGATDSGEAETLESMYKSALEAFGRDMLPTAYQYADEFLILAVYARLDGPSQDDSLVLRLISNLRQGLVNSPSNHHLKLLLINLYSHLGAYDALQSTYESMEIKNIQNYSISYLTLSQTIRLAAGSAANGVVTTAYQFFTSNLFDLANFLVNCFKYGTFLKLTEFIEFMDAVKDSLSFALAISVYASAAVLIGTESELISSTNDDEMKSYIGQIGMRLAKFVRENASSSRAFDINRLLDGSEITSLVDRNDHEILYNWENFDRRQEIEASYKSLIDEQRSLVRLRYLMVHYLIDTINIYNQFEKDSLQPANSNLGKIESCLQEFANSVAVKPESSKINPFSPISTYLNRLNDLGLLKLVNLFVRLGGVIIGNGNFLDDEAIRDHNKNLIEIKGQLTEILTHLKHKMSSYLADYDKTGTTSLGSISRLIESISAGLECVSFCVIVLVACLNVAHVRPMWLERTKKSKKKKDAYLKYSGTLDLVRDIHEEFCHLVAYLTVISRDKLSGSELAAKCERVFQGVEPTVHVVKEEKDRFSNVSSSYVKACEDVKKLFIAKLKILLKLSGGAGEWVEFVENAKSKILFESQ